MQGNRSPSDKQDRELAVQLASQALSPYEFRSWQECRFAFRSYTHYNRIFVIHDLVNGEPVVLGSMRILDASVNPHAGLQIEASIETEFEKHTLTLSHAARAVFSDKIFVHIPFAFTVFYMPDHNTGRMVLKIPIVIKQEGRPGQDGGVRLTPISEFRATHSKFRDLKL